MKPQPCFELNGTSIELSPVEPTESLLRWLNRRGHHGTKEGCADGDCGACTVALLETDAQGHSHFQSCNSCLLPMGSLPGRTVITVEALADGDTLHPVQQALVDCSGSQCGYCTPGFVMSLFAGYYEGALNDETTEGNLCRCTGYRPIRDATHQIAQHIQAPDRFVEMLAQARSPLADASVGSYFNPVSVAAALALKAEHPSAQWIAGATDLGVLLSHGKTVAPALIALDRIISLQTIEVFEDHVRLGAGVTLSQLEHDLQGRFPALDQMLPWFAARQVRNRATLGGNIGSASPIGDLLPVLLALDAQIICVGLGGERRIAADQFFLDYRKTARHPDELIAAVEIPLQTGYLSAAYKVAKRQTDDISIVAAVFALQRDEEGRITQARMAYGGVAAIPLRARKTEAGLIGRRLDAQTLEWAQDALQTEFKPLSDHRASADYRRSLCADLFAKFVAEHAA